MQSIVNNALLDNTALYCRVSTNRQTTENQKARLLQYAIDNNLKFFLFDEVESTRKSRPIKQKLLTMLRSGEFKQVVVYKLDRWARSSRELILEIQELLDKGIGFISISDNLDFSTASGRLHFQILAAFAEFERSLISDRTREGLARKKREGVVLGRPLGSRDSKQRRKSGYIIREAKKRLSSDVEKVNLELLEGYIK
jgi:putative DNA-invertase from lambdoid prophage Rac